MIATAELSACLADARRAKWAADYAQQGYLHIPDLLAPATIATLRSAFADLEREGAIRVGEEDIIDHTDVVFLHEAFAHVLREPAVIALLTALLGPRIELYETKFINKPRRDPGRDWFGWHQDYAYYPHTNYDLLAFGIHLDEENGESGPLRLVPGSHRLGPLSHCEGGQYIFCLNDVPLHAERDAVSLTGPAGFVTVHHCLAVHRSERKVRHGDRRIIYYDVRAQDNVQLAGYVRRSAGYPVTERPQDESRYARFPDGTRVELRGAKGRLYDQFGLLACEAQTPAPPDER